MSTFYYRKPTYFQEGNVFTPICSWGGGLVWYHFLSGCLVHVPSIGSVSKRWSTSKGEDRGFVARGVGYASMGKGTLWRGRKLGRLPQYSYLVLATEADILLEWILVIFAVVEARIITGKRTPATCTGLCLVPLTLSHVLKIIKPLQERCGDGR